MTEGGELSIDLSEIGVAEPVSVRIDREVAGHERARILGGAEATGRTWRFTFSDLTTAQHVVVDRYLFETAVPATFANFRDGPPGPPPAPPFAVQE